MKVQKVIFTASELNSGLPVMKSVAFDYEIRSGANQVKLVKLKPNDFFMVNDTGKDIEYLFLSDELEIYEYENLTVHPNADFYTFIPCLNNQAVDKPDFPRQEKIVIKGTGTGTATKDLVLYFMNYFK